MPWISSVKPVGIAQLHEVLTGVGMPDPSVREMLQPERKFVVALDAEATPDRQVIPEIELARESLFVSFVERRRDGDANACFQKPAWGIREGLEAEDWNDTPLAEPSSPG